MALPCDPSKARVTDMTNGGSYPPACPDGTQSAAKDVFVSGDPASGSCFYTKEWTCERRSARGFELGPDEVPCALFLDGRPGCGVVAMDTRGYIAIGVGALVVAAVGTGIYLAARR